MSKLHDEWYDSTEWDPGPIPERLREWAVYADLDSEEAYSSAENEDHDSDEWTWNGFTLEELRLMGIRLV
jgi:hypothetical protein